MLAIPYIKIIPYPFEVVLEQYFDYEHIAHVHPRTLGEYVLVQQDADGLVYDQHWPADRRGRRAISRVKQTFRPPGDIWFEFVSGLHRGTKVRSELRPHVDGTEVTETYFIPGLPDWGILRRLLRPMVVRQVDRIWDEDLQVGVCIGGWPGTPPESPHPRVKAKSRTLPPGTHRLGRVEEFSLNTPVEVELAAGRVVVIRTDEGYRTLHATCPHTGGPLGLGHYDAGCLVCPWHGARFDATTGKPCSGPTATPLPVYVNQVSQGELIITVEDESPARP